MKLQAIQRQRTVTEVGELTWLECSQKYFVQRLELMSKLYAYGSLICPNKEYEKKLNIKYIKFDIFQVSQSQLYGNLQQKLESKDWETYISNKVSSII